MPNYTQVPNSILDRMADFSDTEFRVIVFVCRQTFGWGKDKAALSISFIAKGCGVSDRGVVYACETLCKKNLISKEKTDQFGGANAFRLILDDLCTDCIGGMQPLHGGYANGDTLPMQPLHTNKEIRKKESTKERGVFDLETFNLMKTALLKVFRPEGRQMNNNEELLLRDIVRDHENPEHELDKIFKFKVGLPDKEKRYFPTSLYSLLEKWDDLLDRAHQAKESKGRQPCF